MKLFLKMNFLNKQIYILNRYIYLSFIIIIFFYNNNI